MKKTYYVIGLMSGTSLDGLDIAYCELRQDNGRWEFSILEAETVNYTQEWKQRLQAAPTLDGLELSLLNTAYGHWTGKTVLQFINKHHINPVLIASHGHTVFHRPKDGMTLQIGSGAAIAAKTGITTVCDFRALNVAIGGQGAPLVPIGDKLLFSDYDACINLGGFANISMGCEKISSKEQTAIKDQTIVSKKASESEETKDPKKESSALGYGRMAFDICPVNIVLNYLAEKMGHSYDPAGSIAAGGLLNKALFEKLENLEYYSMEGPRSLGREWVEKEIIPLLEESGLSVPDLLHTYTHHAAVQIAKTLPRKSGSRVIFTGGGTHNTYLMNLISDISVCKAVIPSNKVIEYKEALVFALLGVLRMEEMNNCLAEATGAPCDCSSGAVHLPPFAFTGRN